MTKTLELVEQADGSIKVLVTLPKNMIAKRECVAVLYPQTTIGGVGAFNAVKGLLDDLHGSRFDGYCLKSYDNR